MHRGPPPLLPPCLRRPTRSPHRPTTTQLSPAHKPSGAWRRHQPPRGPHIPAASNGGTKPAARNLPTRARRPLGPTPWQPGAAAILPSSPSMPRPLHDTRQSGVVHPPRPTRTMGMARTVVGATRLWAPERPKRPPVLSPIPATSQAGGLAGEPPMRPPRLMHPHTHGTRPAHRRQAQESKTKCQRPPRTRRKSGHTYSCPCACANGPHLASHRPVFE